MPKIAQFLKETIGKILTKNCDYRAVQRSALCRSRRELSNAYLLAKFGLDTAENEPCQVCPTEPFPAGHGNRFGRAVGCEVQNRREHLAFLQRRILRERRPAWPASKASKGLRRPAENSAYSGIADCIFDGLVGSVFNHFRAECSANVDKCYRAYLEMSILL